MYAWRKARNIHKREIPIFRQREYYIRSINAGVQFKKMFGRRSQGDLRQDELIGGKLPVDFFDIE
jgi:hypothetical protein